MNIKLTPFTQNHTSVLIRYLDENRKFNINTDPLRLRVYKSDWVKLEASAFKKEIVKGNVEIFFISTDEKKNRFSCSKRRK